MLKCTLVEEKRLDRQKGRRSSLSRVYSFSFDFPYICKYNHQVLGVEKDTEKQA